MVLIVFVLRQNQTLERASLAFRGGVGRTASKSEHGSSASWSRQSMVIHNGNGSNIHSKDRHLSLANESNSKEDSVSTWPRMRVNTEMLKAGYSKYPEEFARAEG